MDKFLVFVYMLMMDASSKTKDSVYNTHLNIWSFLVEEKCTLYMGKYSTCFVWLGYRTRNINNNYSVLLLGVKVNMFCMVGL